jgi:hypothetical protein
MGTRAHFAGHRGTVGPEVQNKRRSKHFSWGEETEVRTACLVRMPTRIARDAEETGWNDDAKEQRRVWIRRRTVGKPFVKDEFGTRAQSVCGYVSNAGWS